MSDEIKRHDELPKSMPSNEQRYFDALRRIARGYEPSERITATAEKRYGLAPTEALEMAYENIQAEAMRAIHGRRRPKQ